MNIQNLAKATKMNPGTIKRHLEDLKRLELVQQIKTTKNQYGQVEKYYRATAKLFQIRIEYNWPV